MTPVLQFLLVLAAMIAGAKLAGLLSSRIGQPAVLGELLVGVLLGPSALNLLGLPFITDAHLADSLSHLAEVGVIFLMFMAGLEVDLGQMRRSGKTVLLAGLLGVVIPLLLGGATALSFGFGLSESLYVGMLLTATSVSISAQTLLELGVLRTRVGIALLGAAVVDDVAVILLLSVMLALASGTGGALGIVWLLARMVIYLAGFTLLGRLVLPWLLDRVRHWPVSEGLLATAVVVTLVFAWAAEIVGGIAVITGAFLAGILVAPTPERHEIEVGMHRLTYGFFVPIFFVNIGLHANIWELQGPLVWLTVAISVVAIVSKVVGAGLGARLGGFENLASLRLGVGMISRGEVGLIVATLLVQNGLLAAEILTLAVVMVLATTLVTPPLLRLAFPAEKPDRPTGEDAALSVAAEE